MRTVFGDHARFVQTYFCTYKGMYFTGDGCRRDKDGYYWIRIQYERKMAGAAQRDRARRDAGGGVSGSTVASGIGQFGAIQIVARRWGWS